MFQIEYLNESINLLINVIEEDFDSVERKIILDYLFILHPSFTRKEISSKIDIDEFIIVTSRINEKCNSRKSLGKYYTPKDLCDFMINDLSKEFRDDLSQKTVFDPTCGNGEFLINYLKFIVQNNVNRNIVDISNKIYGNDINETALLISKVRIFFFLIFSLKDRTENYIASIVKNLNNNFTNVNFINDSNKLSLRFDIIIGNPPYVEDTKYQGEVQEKFGNVYANVLKNSLLNLKEDGILAFVIPLSYVSTARMGKIRKIVSSQTEWQRLYNFADRPDCLFSMVHQKLTVLVCKKNITSLDSNIFSSDYIYWYKKERKDLFNDIRISEVKEYSNFIPKLGSKIAVSIFDKVRIDNNGRSIYDFISETSERSLYLNMRATFWIKVFCDYSRSKEYKEFKIDKRYISFIYCILNSSLFFWFWTVVSDGWHITQKELNLFKIVEFSESKEWEILEDKLSVDLELNKKIVNSKQIDYVYQHKFSKEIIDEIDNKLAGLYCLDTEELSFIKNFAYKYRMSLGN